MSAVIVDAVRTPLGKRNGQLRDWHPVDLAAETLQARSSIATASIPALVDDVILGCVMQVGEQAVNVARNAVLAAGWPETVPGTTVDRQCGSSQQAAHFAAQGVIAGAYDVVVAGGVEVDDAACRWARRWPTASTAGRSARRSGARYAEQGGLVPQGISAEMIAERGSSRARSSTTSALRSQQFAAAATAEGRFESEIMPVLGADGATSNADEGLRDTTLESLAQLKPAFRTEEDGGRVTAGNSSQITDGASAVLIMSEEKAAALGLTPRARFVDFAARRRRSAADAHGADPGDAEGARPRRAVARRHRRRRDQRGVRLGGAGLAAGAASRHGARSTSTAARSPSATRSAASGTRLMATLLNELERTGGRYGLQTMCEGGGMANATIIERL